MFFSNLCYISIDQICEILSPELKIDFSILLDISKKVIIELEEKENQLSNYTLDSIGELEDISNELLSNYIDKFKIKGSHPRDIDYQYECKERSTV